MKGKPTKTATKNITKANGASEHWCDNGVLCHRLRFYSQYGLPLPHGMSQERDKVRSKSSNYDRIVTPQAWHLNRRKPVLYSATLHLLKVDSKKEKL